MANRYRFWGTVTVEKIDDNGDGCAGIFGCLFILVLIGAGVVIYLASQGYAIDQIFQGSLAFVGNIIAFIGTVIKWLITVGEAFIQDPGGTTVQCCFLLALITAPIGWLMGSGK